MKSIKKLHVTVVGNMQLGFIRSFVQPHFIYYLNVRHIK
jgi:hypothetical protein